MPNADNDQPEGSEVSTAADSSGGEFPWSRWGVPNWLGLGACLGALVTALCAAILALSLLTGLFSPGSSRADSSDPSPTTPESQIASDAGGSHPAGEALPTAVPGPNLEIVVDGSTMTLVNLSNRPISLVGVTFRRIAADGGYTATFGAQEWSAVGARSIEALPAGDCFQLRTPDARQTKPSSCDTIQAWLATANLGRHFWRRESDERMFAIVQGDVVVHICQIPVSRCMFYLPQP